MSSSSELLLTGVVGLDNEGVAAPVVGGVAVPLVPPLLLVVLPVVDVVFAVTGLEGEVVVGLVEEKGGRRRDVREGEGGRGVGGRL